MPFRGGFLSVSVYLLCLPFLFLSVPSRATESYSSVGQSATLIMWRSAVQVCLGLLRGGLAQLARAPALQAGGQRFESVILHLPFFWASIFDMLSHKVKTKKSRLCIVVMHCRKVRSMICIVRQVLRAHGGCLGSRRR